MGMLRFLAVAMASLATSFVCLADCPISTIGPMQGQVSSVSVQGNLIYAIQGSRVIVIDATNRTAPVQVGSLDYGRLLISLRMKGSQGMVSCAAGTTGMMRTVDLSDPIAPTQAGVVTPDLGSNGTAIDLDLGSGFAMGIFGGQVSVYNMPNTGTPTGASVGFFPGGGVAATGNNGLVSSTLAGGGVRLLTYAWNGTTLTNLATASAAGTGVSAASGVLAANSSVAIVGTSSGLRVFDITNPATPTPGGSLSLSGTLLDIAISGNLAAAVTSQSLLLFNVSSPAAPTLLSTTTFPDSGALATVSMDGSLVAIGSPGAGVHVIDATNPAAPTRSTFASISPSTLVRASTSGGALVVGTPSGIQFLDVTDRSAPRVTLFKAAPTSTMERFGQYMYTIAGSGFRIYDVSNPSLPPVQLPDVPMPTIFSAFPGQFAFTNIGGVDWLICQYVGQSGAVAAYRMTSPTSPQFFTILPPPLLIRGALAVGGQRSVSAPTSSINNQSIQVVDLSPLGAQPSQAPVVLGELTISTGSTPIGPMVVANNYAYVPLGGVVNIVNVTAAPVLVGSFTLPGGPISAQYTGGRLYYNLGRQVFVYDLSNPAAPTLYRTVTFGLPPNMGMTGGDVRGNELFASVRELGLVISTLGDCCPADFNHDGLLDPDDLGDYITCFFTDPPCAGADFNHDGESNPDDLGDFITSYFNLPC